MSDTTVPQSWSDYSFYDSLGVAPHASQDEIRAAYRRIARRTHPDTGTTDRSEEYTRATVAYEVLRSEQKRREYDAHRLTLRQTQAAQQQRDQEGRGRR